MKLWQKDEGPLTDPIRRKIEQFTIGSDQQWDLCLAAADVQGSAAHAAMLYSIGLLTTEELAAINSGLEAISVRIAQGDFVIEEGVEDVHSQIELLLTRSAGVVGKKVHSGRSRNDQSLLDIKLFIRSELQQISGEMATLFTVLQNLSEQHKACFLPGYTHLQLAMPSSFGLWFGAYAESLDDDLELLIAAYNVANKNPLGSAAGFGSSFPLDRQQTTASLAFASMNYNVVYAQMTRGKTEKITAMALSGIAATLSKLAMDVCLYMNQQFDLISFPDELTTGSSIMPHKKNPDVFELIRAKCNRIQALPNELTLLLTNLPSGYHRDLQLTKECLFPAITALRSCLEMTAFMLEHIIVKDPLGRDEQFRLLFTVESVNELVMQDVSFRDAYRIIARQVADGTYRPGTTTVSHTHEGSSGNLCNDAIKERFFRKLASIDQMAGIG
jgi:argininosuccinate lyase